MIVIYVSMSIELGIFENKDLREVAGDAIARGASREPGRYRRLA
jgi:hypothetical protein